MASVQNVAKFFLTLSQPDEGDVMTHLKLQKLCYYAQGFSLVILDRELFPETIEAWEHGPVVPALWREYRDCGGGPIPIPTDFDADILAMEERELLVDVWNAYGQFSAWKLRNMTHDEAPWSKTPRNSVITHESLRDFFRLRVS